VADIEFGTKPHRWLWRWRTVNPLFTAIKRIEQSGTFNSGCCARDCRMPIITVGAAAGNDPRSLCHQPRLMADWTIINVTN
jgi:hypothetical protein